MPSDTDQPDVLDLSGTEGYRWMLVEIMGHRRVAGRVLETTRYGIRGPQIEVPTEDPDVFDLHWYPGTSVFGQRSMTEDEVREENGLDDVVPFGRMGFDAGSPKLLSDDGSDAIAEVIGRFVGVVITDQLLRAMEMAVTAVSGCPTTAVFDGAIVTVRSGKYEARLGHGVTIHWASKPAGCCTQTGECDFPDCPCDVPRLPE